MADVGDRAQVLLMAALVMAVMFVALALVLNTAIYTENLGTRGSQIAGGGEAVRYLDAVGEGIGGLIGYVNDNHHDSDSDPHGALQANLTDAVQEWSDPAGRQFSTRGRSVEVTLVETTNGSRIARDAEGDFTNASSTADWTLAGNANGTRNFRIEVADTSSLEPFGSGNGFGVNVTDGDDDYWRMNITDDGGSVVVSVRNGSGGEVKCPDVSDPVWINVTAGTVAGDECEGLRFGNGVGEPYEIAFENADNVTGTFTLIVDNTSVATSPSPHLNDVGTDPYGAPAVYSANVSIDYQTPRLFYDATVRVAPGETDE